MSMLPDELEIWSQSVFGEDISAIDSIVSSAEARVNRSHSRGVCQCFVHACVVGWVNSDFLS